MTTAIIACLLNGRTNWSLSALFKQAAFARFRCLKILDGGANPGRASRVTASLVRTARHIRPYISITCHRVGKSGGRDRVLRGEKKDNPLAVAFVFALPWTMAAVSNHASTRVGQIPELLSDIFSYLEGDEKTLFSVVRVNRTWFECGIRTLWVQTSFRRLINIPEHRRQLYASNLQGIFISGVEPQLHSKLKDLKFSKARAACIEVHRRNADYRDRPSINHYLPPSLEELVLVSDDFGKGVFARLKACPKLRSVKLQIADDLTTPDELVDFLKSSPSLEHLDLGIGQSMDEWMSNELLAHLGSRKNLKSLQLPVPISEPTMKKMVNASPTAFDALTSFLACELTPKSVQMLAARTSQTLREVTLDVADPIGETLGFISRCRQLKNLTVVFLSIPGDSIVGSQFKKLENLHNLEKLELLVSEFDPFGLSSRRQVVRDTSDAGFEHVVSKFPRLKSIELDFGMSNWTPASFVTLARHCPLLEKVSLPLSIDVFKMTAVGESVNFPNLRALRFDDLAVPRNKEYVIFPDPPPSLPPQPNTFH